MAMLMQCCPLFCNDMGAWQVFEQSRMGTATPMQSPADTHMTTPGSASNGPEREPSGCGLGLNVDVMVCRAEWYYHVGAYQVWLAQPGLCFCSSPIVHVITRVLFE